MARSGDLIGDRYRLDEPIATGGMGDVWRGTDTVLGRTVAVKMLHQRRAGDPQFQSRFRHEARTLAALHHPGVVGVYDYGEIGEGDDAYLVMAYVEGRSLDDRIAAGRLDAGETMPIVAQAARALHAAHTAGIVHRDVKPGNLILQPDGTVVLVDFGVARSPESVNLTGVDEIVGTAYYLAPEQVSKQQPIGPATDIYALGAVAYQCLAGQPPFLGDNPVTVALRHLNDEPPALPDDVPEAARTVVARAMAKDPRDRFPSAAAMAEAAESGQPVAASGATTAVLPAPVPVPPGPRPATTGRPDTTGRTVPGAAPARSRRTGLLWAGILGVLLALGLVMAVADPFGFAPKQDRPPATPNVPPGSEAVPGRGGSAGPGRSGGPAGGSATPGGGPGGPTTPGTHPSAPAGGGPTPGTTQGATGNPAPTQSQAGQGPPPSS